MTSTGLMSKSFSWRDLPRLMSAFMLSTILLSCSDDAKHVVVIGHRGAPTLALENTMSSFRAARDQGADGVEFDVVLTADGKNIVLHDDTLDRTTNCTGPVTEKNLDQLASCTLDNGEPIRTLDEVLVELGPMFSILFVEVKTVGGRFEEQADEAVRAVLESGYASKIVISSYQAEINTQLAKRQADGINAGWDDPTHDSLSLAKNAGSRWVLMPIASVSTSEGRVAEAMGKHVATYNITTRTEFLKAYDAGVTVMMTDSVPTVQALAAE